ncbi:GTP-binding protein [Rhodothalassium salexigens DSM 2132]|uniref:Large ribosomal subunit assembly factor BipA n=1 Tax=Rhodothalassium salexigens DSM 2132 TaxID=1188247 RepID=A0A4R2PIK3_RHOSA|nr:translational GTPase TypA [Rhodothalassium salexigens]MBB4211382.1 GTP-binding protein [Rhodothalassium salexigens DSM 2132]MBK1637715.1 translational GTPase TypA [Rhodothalassium salexigens DSM 2132]TCP35303.1 GTP-binding protein [Rhodothalassium salexigens DSM 2132]
MALRNIAIIAHVDHGKTTLVDQLFRQSGTFRANQRVDERAMDREDQERERGITILAKCTSVMWGETRLNIVDTPGHADFGGEVERILSMVDGVLLLVDAAEGPMPQTKFVTQKALAIGLRPIVCINKVDKPDADPDAALDQVFDLFAALEADEDQLDFPVLYGSGREGWMADAPDAGDGSLAPLFDKIVEHVPAPRPQRENKLDEPFTMLPTLQERDQFLGRILTGRIESGRVRMGETIKILSLNGVKAGEARITKLFHYEGLARVPVNEAGAGDIIALAGLETATVSDTLCAPEVEQPLEALPIDPPTLSMTFRVNDSPLAGREGDKLTGRLLRDRLFRQAETDVAIHVAETPERDAYQVAGRGELQLAVLIETLRREGFELSVSRPRTVNKKDPETGEIREPIEDVQVDVDEEHQGTVVEKLSQRKAELVEVKPSGGGKVRLVFSAPSRGLIGYHSEFLTDTRGTGIMHRRYSGYTPYKGPIPGRRNGVLISMENGKAVAYALWNLEDRGVIMVEPGSEVYEGMIIGEHSRPNDLEVNPIKSKKLTNIRAAGKDENVQLTPPRVLSLEDALAYIDDDELLEVTPKSIRLRKRFLKAHERKKESRKAEADVL